MLAFLAFAEAVPLSGRAFPSSPGRCWLIPKEPPPQEALPDPHPKGSRLTLPAQISICLLHRMLRTLREGQSAEGLVRCRALSEMAVEGTEKAAVRCSPAQVTVTSAQTRARLRSLEAM